MKGDLARRAFAKSMGESESTGGEPARTVNLEESGEAIMGKAIRQALESKDDAALCRAVKSAVESASYEEEDDAGEMDA